MCQSFIKYLRTGRDRNLSVEFITHMIHCEMSERKGMASEKKDILNAKDSIHANRKHIYYVIYIIYTRKEIIIQL